MNEWRYLNETDQQFSLPGPHASGDNDKVIGFMIKVSHRGQQKTHESGSLNAFEPKFTQIIGVAPCHVSRSWVQRSSSHYRLPAEAYRSTVRRPLLSQSTNCCGS